MSDNRSDRTGGPRSEHNILPIVARPSAGPSKAVIIAGVVIAGALLFTVLDTRRRALTAPPTLARSSELMREQSPPPLFVPPLLRSSAPLVAPIQPVVALRPSPPPARALEPRPAPTLVYVPAPIQQPPPSSPAPAPRNSGGAAIVLDASPGGSGSDDPARRSRDGAGGLAGSGFSGTPLQSRAGRIADRSSTIPQGTIIPAVLETAVNSSGAGLVRALVQRDVSSFDGKHVLLPRGSRLIGEYGSDAGQGQHRLLINWLRLVRPDGVTMAIGSPATDALGAAGVHASVNSHFLARFASAIMQTALNVGVGLAGRSSSSAIIINGSSNVPAAAGALIPPVAVPTLSVRQGSSVSVFVARDLNFADVEPVP